MYPYICCAAPNTSGTSTRKNYCLYTDPCVKEAARSSGLLQSGNAPLEQVISRPAELRWSVSRAYMTSPDLL